MSLNSTPASERIHIGFFGRTNAGKSSLINAITNQEVALVSEIKGTTTDPVKKSMELLPLGPVVLIDTPGMDDKSRLGDLREKRTREVMKQIQAALIVVDSKEGITLVEKELEQWLEEEKIPYLYVFNKIDCYRNSKGNREEKKNEVWVSAVTKENIEVLKGKIGELLPHREEKKLVADLLETGDHVVLVIPIDKSAPKGRLILPQQQTIRDILDAGCTLSVCQVETVAETLEMLKVKPKLVITDSQVFGKVKNMVPDDVMLTSFSILFARYKGNLESAVRGALKLEELNDGDKVLISEGCTHHRQCGDIGTEKLPKWILQYTGKKIEFEFTSGEAFKEDLSAFGLIVHCGACMLNEKQMENRRNAAVENSVEMTNYGILIAYINGILERSVEPFGGIKKFYKNK